MHPVLLLCSLIISQQSQILKLINTDLNTRKEMCMVAYIIYVEKGEGKNIFSAAVTVSEVMRTIRQEGYIFYVLRLSNGGQRRAGLG